jgi:hypothetical protein
MSRMLLIGAVLSLIFLSHSSAYSAEKQKLNSAKTSVSKTGELRSALSKMRTQNKLVQGKNLVMETTAQGDAPAIKLYATVDKGKVTKWQATDAGGKNLPTKTVAAAKGTKCIVCVNTPNGHSECWEIDCGDLPKPKEFASQTATRAQ